MKKIAFICVLTSFIVANENLMQVYKNHTFLHQNFIDQKSSFSIKVPENINTDHIDIVSSCNLKEMKLGEIEPIKDGDYDKSENYKKQLKILTNKFTAIDKKLEFITAKNTFKDSSVDTLKQDGDKVYEAVLQSLNESEILKDEIYELNSKLKEIKVKNVRNLNVSFECEPKFVKVSYPISADIKLQKQISADTAKSQLKIVQKLSIKNRLGYDIENLSINLYPFAYSSNLTPPPFYSQNDGMFHRNSVKAIAKAEIHEEAATMKRSYENVKSDNAQDTLANVWKISNVNLKAGEESVLVYDEQNVDAKFDIVIDGYSGANAYIRAKFTPNNSVEYAATTFDIDGVSVGKAHGFSFESGSESVVYFGKNSLISVKKERNNNFTKESFFGTKSKILESSNYTIKNNSKSTWNITLIERAPVSTHESVSVSIKNNPKESEVSKQGEVSWRFELKPNESKNIEFAYELIRPNKQ